MFEGLGVGSRLAYIRLPQKYNYVPIVGALLFGITTPIGIAVGLGVRQSYNPDSTTASIVSGILDAFSSGILLYTGLVELMAHEFLFNSDMLNGSNSKLAYALCCMILGAGLMALLGRPTLSADTISRIPRIRSNSYTGTGSNPPTPTTHFPPMTDLEDGFQPGRASWDNLHQNGDGGSDLGHPARSHAAGQYPRMPQTHYVTSAESLDHQSHQSHQSHYSQGHGQGQQYQYHDGAPPTPTKSTSPPRSSMESAQSEVRERVPAKSGTW
ncbi:hypothetical protein NUW54_g1334 [Trametes sanguinea]|uniref:Uncharacterized protein n=1 Tax=Trametes sanguinea TaxID=158606 RepID=A0ACC1Q9T3_9APHY|nr:hypothetical protein NUW54_g1334 [Trametes sanguinea]